MKHEGEPSEAETPEPQPGEESEHKTTILVTIEHLGDEAYWIGGLSRGLHVLKKDRFIRIGAGGAGVEETRIQKLFQSSG